LIVLSDFLINGGFPWICHNYSGGLEAFWRITIFFIEFYNHSLAVPPHLCLDVSSMLLSELPNCLMLVALYSSPNIIRMIKSRRMISAGHVARMGKSRSAYRVLVGKPEERNHLEDPGVNRRIILKWILREVGWGHGLYRSGSGEGQVAGSGNELWVG
jgi:hypothetical protein